MTRLALSADARRLAIAGTDAVRITARDRDALEIPVGASTLTFLGDELWTASGVTLRRFARSGDAIGAPVEIAAARPHATLVRAGASVVWGTAEVSRDGRVTAHEDGDFVLPLGASRVLACKRGIASLREARTVRWSTTLAPDAIVIDGCLVGDGRTVALVLARATERAVVLVGLRDGAVLQRIAMPATAQVRLADRRGAAAVLVPEGRLLVIDLRFGRSLVDHAFDEPLCDLAIDPTGEWIAAAAPDYTHVLEASTAELATAPRASLGPLAPPPAPAPPEAAESVTSVDPIEIVATVASEPAGVPGPASAPGDPFACTAALVASVAVRRATPRRSTADETRAIEDAQRTVVAASLHLAIARAWDEGRLAFPDGGDLPYRSEVEGIVVGAVGRAADDVERATVQLARARAGLAALEASVAPRLHPLAALADELGLGSLAREILLVIAAPLWWGELARGYGILCDDDARPLVDEQLVAAILDRVASRAAIADELDASAPLVRTGLVRVGAGTVRPFLPLVVDRIALKLLRGSDALDELGPAIVVRDEARAFASLLLPSATKAAIVETLQRARGPLRLLVRGRAGSGRHTLAATVAAALGRRLGIIDIRGLAGDARGRARELRVALERARLVGLLPCIDGLDLAGPDDAGLRDVIRAHAGDVAVRIGWDAAPPIDPGYLALDVPPLSATERLAAWSRVLVHHGLQVADVSALSARFAIGPGTIERVVNSVASDGELVDDAGPRLDTAVRQHLESRLGTIATRVTRLATWSQVTLPEDIQDSLTELIARIRHRRLVFEGWGFDAVATSARGVTALFQGGPGTGKTLVASAIANELGMDLYRVDVARVMSKWIGETEQNLAKVFDAAEDGNAILLFDEADSLFGKRTEVKSSVDRYANLEVNYLLQRLDTFEGIAILTTNFGSAIDAAFRRRLSLRLTFPFPDDEQREQLWRVHLPAGAPVATDLDLASLARRFRLSGGYIRNCVLRAAFLAAEENVPIRMAHFERAVRAEYREVGKLGEGGQLE